MKNVNKLERLKSFLDKEGIEYMIPKVCDKPGYYNLYITKYRIAVKVTHEGEEDDQVFYERFKRTFYPVFIRTSDTPKFVIKKVQNTIVKAMTVQQEAYMRKLQKKNNKK